MKQQVQAFMEGYSKVHTILDWDVLKENVLLWNIRGLLAYLLQSNRDFHTYITMIKQMVSERDKLFSAL